MFPWGFSFVCRHLQYTVRVYQRVGARFLDAAGSDVVPSP